MVINTNQSCMSRKLYKRLHKVSEHIQFVMFNETNHVDFQNATIIFNDMSQVNVKVHRDEISEFEMFLDSNFINYEFVRNFEFY